MNLALGVRHFHSIEAYSVLNTLISDTLNVPADFFNTIAFKAVGHLS
jgi:hypothetical protein